MTREVIFLDFEYRCPKGERPEPHCLVWRRWGSAQAHHLWLAEGVPSSPPFDSGASTVVCSYNATAEIDCYRALGWELPHHVLDLMVEFRLRSNVGIDRNPKYGLLTALCYFGLDTIESAEKQRWRQLAIDGGPFSEDDKRGLLAYCQTDVDALHDLFEKMHSQIDWDRALLRGGYMRCVSAMNARGVPMDAPLYEEMGEHREEIKRDLIEEINPAYGVYDGTSFRFDWFEDYLKREDLRWRYTDTGRPTVSDSFMKAMALRYPQLQPLRDLRRTLDKFKQMSIAYGADHRNRPSLMPFATKTGRHAPKSAESLFQGPRWERGFVRAEPGRVLAYVDYAAQEFAIAAALSEDPNMLSAYNSGDPYLALAIEAGAAPAGATKASHPNVRALYKIVTLGVGYGQTVHGLARQLEKPQASARKLLRDYNRVYRVFRNWQLKHRDAAYLTHELHALHGWKLRCRGDVRSRTVDNFPMQANGAEMLRSAIIALEAAGIEVVAPVHDAILIECDELDAEEAIHTTRQTMEDVSEQLLLERIRLRTDVEIIGPGERMLTPEVRPMWELVTRRLHVEGRS